METKLKLADFLLMNHSVRISLQNYIATLAHFYNYAGEACVLCIDDVSNTFLKYPVIHPWKRVRCDRIVNPFLVFTDIVGYCDPKATFTPWFDNFTNDETGDSELLDDIKDLRPDLNICAQPSGIQMRVTRNEEPWYTAGNNLNVMSPGGGLQCVNSMQHNKPCENFKVRFCCFGKKF